MEIPLQVTFRNLEYSPFVASLARRKARNLEKFYPRITSIRVMIESSAHRHHQGNLFHVRVDITVPGHEIIVRRDPSERHDRENIRVALRDAFDAARRQLEDYVRSHFRGRQRRHEAPQHGKVVRLFPNEGCGFLQSQDGRDIYFNKNSVLNHGFTKLRIGEEVRFAEEQGDKGPLASTVSRIGKEGKHVKVA